MKKTFAFAALATLMGAPAFAATEPALAEIDANADGFVTIEELQANEMDVTAESFADWDVNGDAKLSEAEYTAWQKASSEDWGKPTVSDKLDDAGDAVEDAMDDAGDALDDAGDEMEER